MQFMPNKNRVNSQTTESTVFIILSIMLSLIAIKLSEPNEERFKLTVMFIACFIIHQCVMFL